MGRGCRGSFGQILHLLKKNGMQNFSLFCSERCLHVTPGDGQPFGGHEENQPMRPSSLLLPRAAGKKDRKE